MTTTIFTIGYEGATVPELVAALKRPEITLLIDIRAVTSSRRPGFSKNALAAEMAAAGIGYRHLKALGTPKAGRDAARKGDHAALEAIYAGQLALPEAQAEAAMMLDLAATGKAALLCYERDPGMCHRSLLLAAVAPTAKVEDLYA